MKPSVSYVVRLVVNEVMKEVVNKPGGFDIATSASRSRPRVKCSTVARRETSTRPLLLALPGDDSLNDVS